VVAPLNSVAVLVVVCVWVVVAAEVTVWELLVVLWNTVEVVVPVTVSVASPSTELPVPVAVRVSSANVVTLANCDWFAVVRRTVEDEPVLADVAYPPAIAFPWRVEVSDATVVAVDAPDSEPLVIVSRTVVVLVAVSLSVKLPLIELPVFVLVRVESR
jgi:hypothetical protein